MSEPALDAQRFLQGADMSEVELAPFVGGELAWFSASCPESDSANQDAAALLPIGPAAAVLAVADGAGGGRSGALAAGLAVRALGEALEEGQREGFLPRTAILNGFERANAAVCALGVGAATTLAVAEIREARMRPYHVGDSLILLVGQRGKVKLETVSHSPVGFAVEAGVLDERDALHHQDRHLVSNILGAQDMRIEMGSERPFAPRDTLLIASDGLSDNLHVREIAEHLRCGSLRDAAEALAATARRRMYAPRSDEPSKVDDLTLLVFRRSR
ncbi:MAG: protein phosphatase 2C domain-containing protein [Deltaproteobacteria bacterium]|nr:protein phosphatase 2C domain-containing protein [Deltaproteobacteria bacterium]